MKRIFISMLLIFSLLLGSVYSVSAATMTKSDFLVLCDSLNTESVLVPVSIQGKLVGGTYGSQVTGYVNDGALFQASLDMTNVKSTVNRVYTEAPTLLSAEDWNDFKNIPVSGSFAITATWTGVNSPAYTLSDVLTGFMFDGSADSAVFDTAAATVTGVTDNSVTATIPIKASAKVSDLQALPQNITLEQSGFSLVSNGQMSGVITGNVTIKSNGFGGYPSDTPITFNFATPAPVNINIISNVVTGGGSLPTYTLAYETNGGTTISSETHAKGKEIKLTKIPEKEGYVFDGWYSDAELTNEITILKLVANTKVYAKWVKERHPVPAQLNGEDHIAYVIGYTDGTVRPNNNITRAEVTTIFFRLLKDEVRDTNLAYENAFDDVNDGDWHNAAISTMAKLGIVNGRFENKFDPDEFITRAEFTAICARFDDTDIAYEGSFNDIDGHWAADYIKRAAAYGWIEGYSDNTFRPDQFITRAEAMTLINRVLNRILKGTEGLLHESMSIWSDNTDSTEWYYTAVQEATHSTEYERSNSAYKTWTKVIENRDWSQYQK